MNYRDITVKEWHKLRMGDVVYTAQTHKPRTILYKLDDTIVLERLKGDKVDTVSYDMDHKYQFVLEENYILLADRHQSLWQKIKHFIFMKDL